MARGRCVTAVGGAVVVISVVSGCTAAEEDPQSPPSAPVAPSSGSPASDSPEQGALAAYEGMWDVIVENSRTTDPDLSTLERYAEGQALELAQHGLGAESDENAVARGEPEFSPEVVGLGEDEESAEIEDCMDSTGWLREDADTGELVEESPTSPIRRRIEATADSDALGWRVSKLRIFEQGSC